MTDRTCEYNYTKGDKVKALWGRRKGKTGIIARVFPDIAYSVQVRFGYNDFFSYFPSEIELISKAKGGKL